MEKKSLKLQLVVAILLGVVVVVLLALGVKNCIGGKSNKNEETTDGEKTIVELEENDFAVTLLKEESSQGKYIAYYTVKNNSKSSASINGTATAYDDKNKVKGKSQKSIDVVGAGETVVVPFEFTIADGCSNIKLDMTYLKATEYKAAAHNLKCNITKSDKNIDIEIVNNAEEAAVIDTMYIVLYNNDGDVKTIKENKISENTVGSYANTYHQIVTMDSYDDVKVYLTAHQSENYSKDTSKSPAFIFLIAVVLLIAQRCIWGYMCDKTIEGKGYYENWFLRGFLFGLITYIVTLHREERIDLYASAVATTEELVPVLPEVEDIIETKEATDQVSKLLNSNKLEQMKKYKELLDNGKISQEEFDKMKRNVLRSKTKQEAY